MAEETLDAFEKAYNFKVKPEHRTLLLMDKALLDGVEKQEAYLLTMALGPMQCPICNVLTCKLAASPDYDPRGADDGPYRCPTCKARLNANLGLHGEQWFTRHPDQIVEVK